jgi:flagellar hook-basal body complex protein FliE
MDIYLGNSTLGLPVPDFTKGAARVDLLRTSEQHFDLNGQRGVIETQPQARFAHLLTQAMDGVSSSQHEADRLVGLAITDPASVEVHDISIAMAKANMSLSVTKAVIDRTITSFKEILNQR